ncbi:bifunctional 4-hydroxy-2-oxoglutarate aldolase/2-dehydro-3-deoxy-phosphogluconate aldolase [Bacillus infantis]|uniref:bifunctional 4-hydroxy-2-oxoglutarate aldolase/2-dehydro-3-deoxy-phosphogluconate aldolase n=1 Tax=Bacillus infantis TaxID=324767 RepID=UPI000B9B0283|nr:bifunctional 4-hydroxy-2-oxoglutarate aldolase/2-dehydro-3-deoxy-phosphogluconate aldolase [Bacillus infantis]MCK6208779.1 bifunctional 4-hydroxy-2-oxoglutarate aldolase/2-dehydro-3-deoxy-phosphogluconate aldolase [Bacillus infantis]OXT16641.1 2-dehydro-3-deoxyphosphogluconate aldolase [Bacillus sp. OG2]
MNLVDQIKENGIVAVIRGSSADNIVSIAHALKRGGVKTLEITVETPRVLSLIEKVSEELGDEVIVGAGTVLDPETARAAIMAGARFIFSPTTNTETIKMAKRYGVVSIPGALTPTEIITAYEHGADMIKVFPANVFGPGYIKDIHGPMPHIPLMPTGGLDTGNVGDYIRAGAVAAGIGSSLVNTKLPVTEEYLADIEAKAGQFVQAVAEARS